MKRLIDPDFMREIEISLITMTDYAKNRVGADNGVEKIMEKIRQKDIEQAELILESIADWFESLS